MNNVITSMKNRLAEKDESRIGRQSCHPPLAHFNSTSMDCSENVWHYQKEKGTNNEPGHMELLIFVVISSVIHILIIFFFLKMNHDIIEKILVKESVIEVEINFSSPYETKPIAVDSAEKIQNKDSIKIESSDESHQSKISINEKKSLPDKKAVDDKHKKIKVSCSYRPAVNSLSMIKNNDSKKSKKAESVSEIPKSLSYDHHDIKNRDGKQKQINENLVKANKSGPANPDTSSIPDYDNNEKYFKQKYINENFLYIKDLIMQSLSYPGVARRMKWQGIVVVSFIVLENGLVESIKIVSSSGYNVLDNNVLRTIGKVQPFPKPPVRAELIIPIKYILSG